MHRATRWILVLLLAVLTHPQVRAEPSPMLHNPNNTKVLLPFSLVATATATRPVIVGQGSSTASPSTAPGGLFLSVEIPSTGGGISMDNASLTVSALCTGSAIEPLLVGPIQIYIGTQPARTTASLFVNVELPWDGGRKELADADYYLERSYSCTATVQLNTSSLRSKKVTTNAIVWNVLVAEQAATISTVQPTNGNEMHSATFQAASLDSTAPTTPVTVGIPPGTRTTVDGQTPPLGSPVNISFDQPLGADIPGGSEMPPLVAPVVRVGPEAASFDEAVVLGLTPSGPLAEIEAPVPITYDEGVQDWVDCQQDGSCQEIPCPDAEGFEPGMVCIEVYHFSLWSLGSDKQWVIQIELMTDDGKATASPWKCSQGSLCPTGMVGRLVYEHPADIATRKARIRVCIPAGEEQTCNGGTLVKGLKDWGTPGCFSGGKCPFTGGAVSEDSGNPGNYYIDLFQLTLTGWGSLQVSVEAEDVTGLPKATLDVLSTSCSGDTSHQDSTTLYDCLNLGIKPKLDKATLDTSNKTLAVLTTSSFTGSTNLKSGTLALYPADATQCSNTWNPATAGVTGLSIQTASLTATSAIATTSLTTMANVRAQLATSTYGTVLGPCIPVTILAADVDKDGFTAALGDCNDNNAAVKPGATETCNGIDDNCTSGIDEGFTRSLYYRDADGDGYGLEATSIQDCAKPSGYSDQRGDCNDSSSSYRPFAAEPSSTDGKDMDCGGTDGTDPSVKDPSKSIQSALDSSKNGQTIWVGPGTYTQYNLDFKGKLVTLISTAFEARTIIDAQQKGRGFYFHSGETEGAVLNGFTVKNGAGDKGGGIFIEYSSPLLTQLTVSGNEAWDGAGVYMYDSASRMTKITIQDNFIYGSGQGGGIYMEQSSPIMSQIIITGNVAEGGGGMHMEASRARMDHMIISDNWAGFGDGGGISMDSSDPELSHTVLTDNQTGEGAGGGISIFDSREPLLEHVTISGNRAYHGGGGIYMEGSAAYLSYVSLSENEGAHGGGGMELRSSSPSLEQVTMTGNLGDDEGGIYLNSYSSPRMYNVVLAYNTGYNIYQSTSFPGSPVFTNVVFYNPSGQSNYFGVNPSSTTYTWEPGFLAYATDGVPTDLHLSKASKAINAGSASIFDPDGTRSDIGAYGGPAADEWDRDDDGFPDWFWPGTIEQPPSGFSRSSFDANDQDAGVH